MSQTYIARMFRKLPGDLDRMDFPIPADGLDEAKAILKEELRSTFEAVRPGSSKPTYALLVDEGGSVCAQFRMNPLSEDMKLVTPTARELEEFQWEFNRDGSHRRPKPKFVP